MSLLSKLIHKLHDDRLVHWAPLDAWIPIVCNKCGAVFVTRNREPLGCSDVVYGSNYDDCRQCIRSRHKLGNYKPSLYLYEQGGY